MNIDDEEMPQERIATAYRELRAALIAELLDSIRDQAPISLSTLCSMCCKPSGMAAAAKMPQIGLVKAEMRESTESSAKTV